MLKNISNTKIFYVLLSIFVILIIVAADYNDNNESSFELVQDGDWKAPSAVDKLVNPIKELKKALQEGENLYASQCSICHGENGEGDGIAGMGLTPRPADLTSKEFQKQSDGAIFWKLTSGRPPMASYAEIFTAKQRWQMVTYLRTLVDKK